MKSRGKRLIFFSQLYLIAGAVAIICIQVWSYFAKQRLILDNALKRSNALYIDLFVIYIFIAFCITLLTALVIFKVLDKRHKIKIKKFQLFVSFLLTVDTTVLSFF